jgi:hypothetical protein
MKIKVLLILALTLTIPMLMAPMVHASNPDVYPDAKYVDIQDIVLAGSQYGLTGSARNMTIVNRADFNGNGIVDLFDLVTMITMWHTVGYP